MRSKVLKCAKIIPLITCKNAITLYVVMHIVIV